VKPARFIALLAFSATAAFAARPATAWKPSPDMTGTFHALLGDNLLTIAPDGHCEISFPSMEFHAVGSLRPDPTGKADRFLAELPSAPGPDTEGLSDTTTLLFSYAPADRAWQMLSVDDGNCCVVSLEEESSMIVDGGVERDDAWFMGRFVPDPASFDWLAASDAARRHFMGTWKNLGDEDDGASVFLSSDGSGTIENKNLPAPATCKWSVVRHDNGWHVICEITDNGSPSVLPEPYFAVLEPDDQFRRLRLVNITRHFGLAMASDNPDPLPDPAPTYFDRIAPPPPAGPAAQEEPPSAP